MSELSAAEQQITDRLVRLSTEQKVRLLTGADTWALHSEPAIGLGRIVVSDGPSGVRGELWDERDPSLNLPSATALAATWDPDLAYRYGAAMAAEAHRKGVHVVLGPTINLHRSPLGGRHFEAYSEDPELTSVIGEAFVRGLQDHGIGACPKHYVANDFETERFTASVTVSERALRELYLMPFERTVAAGAWTVMSAYNAVGGVSMTEHDLLASPLCEEWGFGGVVISDWGAVRSVVPSGRARQDLAMPGPDSPWAQGLLAAVQDGEVPIEAIDEKARRILRLAGRVGGLDGVQPEPARRPDLDGVALAREVAGQGMVLVRNDGVLPLAAPRSVAMVGQSATVARTQGGGSATVVPESTVAPLAGLRAALPDASISYALGAVVHGGIFPLDLATITDPRSGEPGMRARFTGRDGEVLLDEHRLGSELIWLGNAPRGAAELELVADLRPEQSGPVELGVQTVGHSTLELDGEVLLDVRLATDGTDLGVELLFPPYRTVRADLTAGRVHRLRVTVDLADDTVRTPGVIVVTVGSRPVAEDAEVLIADAVAAAAAAEVAIVVVGTNAQVESEGFDRTSLALPGHQDALVHAVAAANPRTVVVVNAGAPVLMPWRHEVAAVLLTWFGGEQYGHALADVLRGVVEPGGRLPTTWPGTEADVPVLDTTPVGGVVRYDEGIHIGYRAWQRVGRAPAYPFGFGLGYTTWRYDGARVADSADPVDPVDPAGPVDPTDPADPADPAGGDVTVRVDLTNTGDRHGREVVQVYLSRAGSAVDRPVRWLAGSAVVTADAGASVTAEIAVRARAFQHWDEAAGSWAAEPGAFTLVVARHVDAEGLSMPVVRG